MSTQTRFNPDRYKTGSDRYIRFGNDYLDVKYAEVQKKILRAVADNQRLLIISGNGPGKTFSMATCVLGFLYSNPDSTVMGTSGSYSQFVDTMWRPLENMHDRLEEQGLPGRTLGGRSPQLEIDDEWYAKVISPRDPGELEGRHGNAVMVVIEESDKPYITEEHFDSANSSITDSKDRVVAIANPPEDETDVVWKKKKSDRWTTIQFSSFESHNVLADVGEVQGRIPHVVDLPTIADDWEAWNNEPWPQKPDWCPPVTDLLDRKEEGRITHEKLCELLAPGFDEVRHAHENRDDLDIRWYRRRAGVIPKAGATKHRPFKPNHVEEAFQPEWIDLEGRIPDSAALDVARDGGDWNVLSLVLDETVITEKKWKGVDHVENENVVREYTDDWPHYVPLAVDAQGEGSGLADRLQQAHPGTVRFQAGSEAGNERKYYSCWDEGLDAFGQFMKNGGTFTNKGLREEALACSRAVSFEEKYYKSRSSEVLKADSKDKVKDRLDRSPDILDSGYMAVWVRNNEGSNKLTW